MSTNAIWTRFEKTDPAHTKQFQRGGGFKGTAINGTYIVKKLTSEFGPCGKGWKFVMDDERIEEGHTLKNGDKAKVHIVRGHLEYQVEGTWYSTSPQFGQTMLVDENKYGPFTDEEAPKKSITDCISKCAVLLGIGADIHLGLFDDVKYVNQRKAEEAAEHANGNGNGNGHGIEPLPPLQRPKNGGGDKAAAMKWVQTSEELIGRLSKPHDLRVWEDKNKEALAKLKAMDIDMYDRVMEAVQARQLTLSPLNS